MPGIGSSAALFGKFERFSGVVSAADLAAYDSTGAAEPDPVTPLLVHFVPSAALQQKFAQRWFLPLDFRTWTTVEADIPVGSLLYTAYTTVDRSSGEPTLCVDEIGLPQGDAEGVAAHCPTQQVVPLGTIITKSRFYASSWADQSLAFQHTRMCPKDQTQCLIVKEQGGLNTFPVPSYAIDPDRVCISDDTKNGTVSGTAPSCPANTTEDTEISSSNNETTTITCFPNATTTIRETQEQQCPFLNQVAASITLGEEPTERSCTATSQFITSWIVTPLFALVATVARAVSGVWNVILWPLSWLGL